jgi:hypothetical protein
MFIGGLWHGAGWNYAIWGALHGLYLMSNHSWMKFKHLLAVPLPIPLKKFAAWGLSFTAVVVGWVFFRATSLDSALSILQGMLGMNGVSIPNGVMARLGSIQEVLPKLGITVHLGGGTNFIYTWLWIIVLFPCVLTLPTTQDLFFKVNGSLSRVQYEKSLAFWPLFSKVNKLYWKDNKFWVGFISVALVFGLLTLSQVSEFLYFQF